MAIEYRATYKCRLCGELFEGGSTRDFEVAVKAVADAASNMESFCHMIYVHHCNDDDIGIADFIG